MVAHDPRKICQDRVGHRRMRHQLIIVEEVRAPFGNDAVRAILHPEHADPLRSQERHSFEHCFVEAILQRHRAPDDWRQLQVVTAQDDLAGTAIDGSG